MKHLLSVFGGKAGAALAAAGLVFAAYLFFYEDTAMNRVVAGALLLPLAGLFFVLSNRLRASFAAGIVMLLLLAFLSRAKYDITTVSISVFDAALLDPGALGFALRQEQFFWQKIAAAAALLLVLLLFWLENRGEWRGPKRLAAFVAATAIFLGLAFAQDKGERSLLAMNGEIGQLSYFAKSITHLPAFFGDGGFMSRAALDDPALPPPEAALGAERCATVEKPPHIIIISDESAMDTTVQPGIAPDPVLAPFFASFDGVKRTMISESYGGQTWLAETSVLTGLSTRAFGGFAPIVPRIIAAGEVRFNLPAWLKGCGYGSVSFYPADGRFAGAAGMHQALAVDRFEDQASMGNVEERQRDAFYYDKLIGALKDSAGKPLFAFIWTTSNHFPWDFAFAPEMEITGIPPSPRPSIAEYRRRQRISQIDYKAMVARLKAEFPGERFVILRYGDHQPYMGNFMSAPELTREAAQPRIAAFEQRFYETYYAFDLVNMAPAAPLSTLRLMAVPYLPGQLLKLAGIPLPPPLAYSDAMLERCAGQFADCQGGVEMNRFNAWLVREGFVKGL